MSKLKVLAGLVLLRAVMEESRWLVDGCFLPATSYHLPYMYITASKFYIFIRTPVILD